MSESHCPDRGKTPGLCLCLSRRRALILLILSILWAGVIVLRMGQIMIVERSDLLSDIDRESWHRGMIPAQRGRILDSSGLPLAWSVRRLRLVWEVPKDTRTAQSQWDEISGINGLPVAIGGDDYRRMRGTTCVLVEDIPAAFAPEVFALCNRQDTLTMVPYFVRHRSGSRAIRRSLGHVLQRNGVEVGLDGYERVHDSLLRGRPGIFRVMVDQDGKWMMETWEKVQDMQPGYDVFLPVSRSKG